MNKGWTIRKVMGWGVGVGGWVKNKKRIHARESDFKNYYAKK